MLSDILVLLKDAVDDTAAETVRSAIYQATGSAVVTWDPQRSRALLVRFDPKQDTPSDILGAVRAVGHEATIAGG